MRVQFLGIRNQRRKRGCSSCGGKQVSTHTFQREARMVLPGGQTKTFYAGETYDVNERVGNFLLEQTYHLNGVSKAMFKEV